jgi:hypothetical protein
MDNLTAESASVKLYAALEGSGEIPLQTIAWHLSNNPVGEQWHRVAAEHERICSERIAAIAIERDRLQQDSIEQAKAINRLAAAAEDRNIVDKNKEEFFIERIAAAVKAARVEALRDAVVICSSFHAKYLSKNSAISDQTARSIQYQISALITAAEAQTGADQ